MIDFLLTLTGSSTKFLWYQALTLTPLEINACQAVLSKLSPFLFLGTGRLSRILDSWYVV